MALEGSQGSPLASPENTGTPGVARPSDLVDSDQKGNAADTGVPNPDRQLTQVISKIRQMETDLEGLASAYPGAAPNLRKVTDFLRRALTQIVATGSGPGQETPSPRMLG